MPSISAGATFASDVASRPRLATARLFLVPIRTGLEIVARLVVASLLLGAAAAAETSGPEISLQLGHPNTPRALAISHDGRWLASGDVARRLIVWELASARQLWAISVDGTGISALSFSPDDSHLAVGGYDGSTRIVEVDSARVVARIQGRLPNNEVKSLAYRGAAVLLAHHAGRLEQWSTATWTRTAETRLSLPGPPPRWSRFTPSGRHLLVSHDSGRPADRRSRVLDTTDGALLAEISAAPADIVESGSGFALFSVEGRRVVRHDMGRPTPTAVYDDPAAALSSDPSPLASADGRVVAVDATGATLLVDVSTGKTATLPRQGFSFIQAPWVASSRHLAYPGPNGAVRVIDLGRDGGGPTVKNFGGMASAVLTGAFTADGRSLLVVNRSPSGELGALGGRWTELDTERWTVKGVHRTEPGAADAIEALQLRGSDLLVGFSSGDAQFVVAAAGRAPSILRPPSPAPGSVSARGFVQACPTAISADGRVGAASRGLTIDVWDLDARILRRRITEYEALTTTFDFAIGCPIQDLALSPDGRHLAVINRSHVRLDVFDTVTGAIVSSAEPPEARSAPMLAPIAFRALSFDAQGNRLAATSESRTVIFELPSLRAIRDLGRGSGGRRLAFSPDAGLLAVAMADSTVKLWPTAAAGPPTTLAGHADAVTSLRFSPARPRLATTSRDGTTRIWNPITGSELARLAVFSDGEWLLMTPEGYFTGSRHGPEQFTFRTGRRLLGLNQFYDVFYRPDLVHAKLDGKDIEPLIKVRVADALRAPPPDVDVKLAGQRDDRATVRYRVHSTGGGIGEVRAFFNGKLVQTGPAAQGDLEIETVDGDNEVTVVAFNGENSVHSALRGVKYTARRSEAPPHLYVLAIGIDRYRDRSVTLTNAVRDSVAFASRFSDAATSYFPRDKIAVTRLADLQATRAGIRTALAALVQTARPQDVVAVFMAGHAVIHDNRFALLTHTYDGRLADEHVLAGDELIEASRQIKSLNQIFVLDTCHAGGLNDRLAGYYDSRLTLLARNAGIHVLAGATDEQGALDNYQGNGLFTHVLLEGLAAREADSNADGAISVVELGQYTELHVRRIADTLKVRQSPVFLHFGRDRPLARVGP